MVSAMFSKTLICLVSMLSFLTLVNATWERAYATFYGGKDLSGTCDGSCGYGDTRQSGYGECIVGVSPSLYKEGLGCGACYEVKCENHPKCLPGCPTANVTATNLCPSASPPNDGWCPQPCHHFELAQPVFLRIAEECAGIVPISYRRVPCCRQGGIRFTITGNAHSNLVLVTNVAGAGDVVGVCIKGCNTDWLPTTRTRGQNWQSNIHLVGQKLSFRVTTSDNRVSTSMDIAPNNWQFGQTFVGENFC